MRNQWRKILDWAFNADLGAALRLWLSTNKLLTFALTCTAAVGYGLSRQIAYLNGPPEYYLHYIPYRDFWPTWLGSLAPAGGGAIMLLAAYRLIGRIIRGRNGRRWLGLGLLVLWGVFYHWLSFALGTSIGLGHMGRAILDGMVHGYYTVAQEIGTGRLPDLQGTLLDYPKLMTGFPMHASTHPPGPVLIGYVVHNLFTSHPDWAGAIFKIGSRVGLDPRWMLRFPLTDKAGAVAVSMLLTIAGLLAVFPLTGLIRQAHGNTREGDRIAWAAALLWAHYPGLILFTPEYDQAYATLGLLCVYCAGRGLRAHPAAWGIAVGLLLMVSIASSFTLLFLIPMLCLLAWLHYWREAAALRNPMEDPATFSRAGSTRFPWRLALSASLTALIIDWGLKAAGGINLFAIFQAALDQQNQHLLKYIQRTYWIWVFFNIYDFLFFGGPALAVLALAYCLRRRILTRPAQNIPAWSIYPLGLMLLNVSGLTPGETGRIWLFLAPGMAWAAAEELPHRYPGRWRANLAFLLCAQYGFLYLCHTKLQILAEWFLVN